MTSLTLTLSAVAVQAHPAPQLFIRLPPITNIALRYAVIMSHVYHNGNS